VNDVPAEVKPFFRPIVRMVKAWGGPIFNYYEARYINGLVENLNGRINEINRRGFGYDFETLRAKALLRYGTPRAARPPGPVQLPVRHHARADRRDRQRSGRTRR